MTKFRHRPRSHTKPASHGGDGRRGHAHPAAHSPGPKIFVEGILQVKGKVGFVLSEDPKAGDVLIQGPTLRLAMEGDRVRARVTSGPGEPRRSGDIVETLARARETIVGTFKRLGNMAAVIAESDQSLVRILDMRGFAPKVGDVVVARITRWPTLQDHAAGNLTEVLGARNAPGVELAAVIRKYGLTETFPPEVEKEAESHGSDVPESAWKNSNRELFFNERVFTIDGADAKDFDDAVSLEPIENGWRLGVHIADVAHYVLESSPLDQEAYRRGTSVYLTGSVLPMLPFALSDNLCSLRPDLVRLTLSCVMDIDREGHVTNYRVVESAIRSAKRFTYTEVEEILNGGNPAGLEARIISDIRAMGELARLVRRKRFERGSLDFDFPEPDVVTDLKGRPIDIRRRERLEAHRLIEDFMVLANETVARHMRSQPFLYRIHETPDPARGEKLRKALEVMGLRAPTDLSRPISLSGILKQCEGTTLKQVVHLSILRSLKQAVYSPVNKGHYGLASECYTHFTSPIRRYPDLIVHRRLKERMHHHNRTDYWTGALPALCDHSSKRERVAVEAEREFMDIQKTRLMEPRVGETFTGVISSVTNFGFFVQLNEFFVEGLVHVTTLRNDFFVFDEARMTLTGRRSGRVFSLGTKVRVKLAAANVLKHQLDFELLTGDSESGSHHRPAMAHRGHHRFKKHRRR